jgi:mono/diheme cytochrome c family protein
MVQSKGPAVVLELIFAALTGLLGAVGEQPQGPFDKELSKESPALLAKDARKLGDPARGALLFYRPQLGCARCHRIGSEGIGVGPDLSKPGKDTTDVYLVESILREIGVSSFFQFAGK